MASYEQQALPSHCTVAALLPASASAAAPPRRCRALSSSPQALPRAARWRLPLRCAAPRCAGSPPPAPARAPALLPRRRVLAHRLLSPMQLCLSALAEHSARASSVTLPVYCIMNVNFVGVVRGICTRRAHVRVQSSRRRAPRHSDSASLQRAPLPLRPLVHS